MLLLHLFSHQPPSLHTTASLLYSYFNSRTHYTRRTFPVVFHVFKWCCFEMLEKARGWRNRGKSRPNSFSNCWNYKIYIYIYYNECLIGVVVKHLSDKGSSTWGVIREHIDGNDGRADLTKKELADWGIRKWRILQLLTDRSAKTDSLVKVCKSWKTNRCLRNGFNMSFSTQVRGYKWATVKVTIQVVGNNSFRT